MDFDDAVYDLPKVTVFPRNPEAKFALPLTVTVAYIKNKKAVEIGNITLSSTLNLKPT